MSTRAPIQPVTPLWTPAAWLRAACEAAINAYQRWLSPHKGYCCAHRVLHKGESCSQYVKRAIVVGGVRQACGLARARFQACGKAAARLERRKMRVAIGLAAVGTLAATPALAADGAAQRQVPDAREDFAGRAIDLAFDVTEAVGEEALDATREGAGSAIADFLGDLAQGTGEVLAGGLDMAGAACEGLAGGVGECLLGGLAGGCSF